ATTLPDPPQLKGGGKTVVSVVQRRASDTLGPCCARTAEFPPIVNKMANTSEPRVDGTKPRMLGLKRMSPSCWFNSWKCPNARSTKSPWLTISCPGRKVLLSTLAPSLPQKKRGRRHSPASPVSLDAPLGFVPST